MFYFIFTFHSISLLDLDFTQFIIILPLPTNENLKFRKNLLLPPIICKKLIYACS